MKSLRFILAIMAATIISSVGFSHNSDVTTKEGKIKVVLVSDCSDLASLTSDNVDLVVVSVEADFLKSENFGGDLLLRECSVVRASDLFVKPPSLLRDSHRPPLVDIYTHSRLHLDGKRIKENAPPGTVYHNEIC